MQSFTKQESGALVLDLVRAIQANKQYLSYIDGLIGDGDHGINMNKGFTIAGKLIKADPGDLRQNLLALSHVLMNDIRGSMGPLYGMFFRSLARPIKDFEVIDLEVMRKMLQSAVSGIQTISDAKPGDKTLMDTLLPAALALSEAADSRCDLERALDLMALAARNGRDSTKEMVAQLGRSARLGERSRGVTDAGAASCCLILRPWPHR